MPNPTMMRSDAHVRIVEPPRSRSRAPHSGWPSAFGMMVFAAIVFPIIVVLGSAYYVWSTGKVHDGTPTDAIIVLGAAQFDGTPSPVLKSRLDHSLDLYRNDVASQVVTVGGKQSGDRFTEAGAGRQYLIEQGVSPDRVVAVKAGTDTIESLSDVAKLAEQRGWTSITIVSDPAHMARSKAIANRLGFDAHTNPTMSGDGSQVTDSYLARETMAYLGFEVIQQWKIDPIVGQS